MSSQIYDHLKDEVTQQKINSLPVHQSGARFKFVKNNFTKKQSDLSTQTQDERKKQKQREATWRCQIHVLIYLLLKLT